MTHSVDKHTQFTKDGFLVDWQSWNETIANTIANQNHIKLIDNHWDIIHAIRTFYQEFALIPTLRVFINYLKKDLDKPDINSIYLHQLFPAETLKTICKIAGLPKPPHCF